MMKPVDVLFLCETNAAASLMAEAYLNGRGSGALRAFSAGRVPAEAMLSEARESLAARGLPTSGLAPKDVSLFALPGAPSVDLVVDLSADGDERTMTGLPRLRWPLAEACRVPAALRRTICDGLLDAIVIRIEQDLAKAAARSRRLGAGA